jgi:hypothetical protein
MTVVSYAPLPHPSYLAGEVNLCFVKIGIEWDQMFEEEMLGEVGEVRIELAYSLSVSVVI